MADIVPSKTAVLADNKKLRARLSRISSEGKRVGMNMTSALVGGGTAFGSGMLFNKFPNAMKIKKVDTRLAGGALLVLLGAIGKGRMSGAVQAAGEGLLYPWLFEYGYNMDFG